MVSVFKPTAPAPRCDLQVIMDIDDTVKSSGGVRLGTIPIGGVDTQYARGEFYPGVFQFIFALAEYSRPSELAPPRKAAVLTARAREFLWALQLTEDNPVCQAFRNVGRKNGCDDWGVGSVYYGSVQEWIFQDQKGRRKFDNFKLLLEEQKQSVSSQEKDKQISYVFVGDTGEQDQQAGEWMLIHYPALMKALFLHVVTFDATKPDPFPQDILINGVPVLFFRTYVGAALKAVQHQLMSVEGLKMVIDQARVDVMDIPEGSTKRRDLEDDVMEAKLMFPSELLGVS